jgi:hypothetical protein
MPKMIAMSSPVILKGCNKLAKAVDLISTFDQQPVSTKLSRRQGSAECLDLIVCFLDRKRRDQDAIVQPFQDVNL